MDKSEVRQIVAFLKDVQEGLYEGDEVVTMQAQLAAPGGWVGALRETG